MINYTTKLEASNIQKVTYTLTKRNNNKLKSSMTVSNLSNLSNFNFLETVSNFSNFLIYNKELELEPQKLENRGLG